MLSVFKQWINFVSKIKLCFDLHYNLMRYRISCRFAIYTRTHRQRYTAHLHDMLSRTSTACIIIIIQYNTQCAMVPIKTVHIPRSASAIRFDRLEKCIYNNTKINPPLFDFQCFYCARIRSQCTHIYMYWCYVSNVRRIYIYTE